LTRPPRTLLRPPPGRARSPDQNHAPDSGCWWGGAGMARRVGRRTGSAGGRGVGAACAHARRESEAHLSPSYPAGPFAIPIQPSRPALVGLDQVTRGTKGACSGRITRPRRCACGGCALPWGPTRGASRETPPPERTRPSRGSRLAAGRLALPLRSPATNQPPGLPAARGTPRAGKWSPRNQKKEQKKPTWLAKKSSGDGARRSLSLSSLVQPARPLLTPLPPQHPMKLTIALAALAALASSTSALPPFPKPPVPGNPACLAHIGTLRNGACGPIAKKVTKETAVAIAGASCAELEAMTITADVSFFACVGEKRGGRRGRQREFSARAWPAWSACEWSTCVPARAPACSLASPSHPETRRCHACWSAPGYRRPCSGPYQATAAGRTKSAHFFSGGRLLAMAGPHAAPPHAALTHTPCPLSHPRPHPHTTQASDACCADAVKFVQDVSFERVLRETEG